MTEGRLFHKVGPAWAKARVPQVVATSNGSDPPQGLDERHINRYASDSGKRGGGGGVWSR